MLKPQQSLKTACKNPTCFWFGSSDLVYSAVLSFWVRRKTCEKYPKKREQPNRLNPSFQIKSKLDFWFGSSDLVYSAVLSFWDIFRKFFCEPKKREQPNRLNPSFQIKNPTCFWFGSSDLVYSAVLSFWDIFRKFFCEPKKREQPNRLKHEITSSFCEHEHKFNNDLYGLQKSFPSQKKSGPTYSNVSSRQLDWVNDRTDLSYEHQLQRIPVSLADLQPAKNEWFWRVQKIRWSRNLISGAVLSSIIAVWPQR